MLGGLPKPAGLKGPRRSWSQLAVTIALTGTILAGVSVARRASAFASSRKPAALTGQASTPVGVADIRAIADAARNPDLRWPDFAPYKSEFSKFYEGNGYSLGWIQNGHARPQVIAENADLDFLFGIGQHRSGGHFRAGAAGGRQTDHRHDGAGELVVAGVIERLSAVRQQGGGDLGQIHVAAAADSEYGVGAKFATALD